MNMKLLGAEVLLYVLFLAFILIENPVFVAVYIAAIVAGIFFAAKKYPEKLPVWYDLFMANLKQVGAVAFVLGLTLPIIIDGDAYWF